MRFPKLPFSRNPTGEANSISGGPASAGATPVQSTATKNEHGAPQVVAVDGITNNGATAQPGPVEEYIERNPKNKRWYAYYLTRDFYYVLALG